MEYVGIVQRLINENSASIGQVSNAVLAVMLIRGVDELNTRLETLEDIASRSLPTSRNP